MFKPSVFYANNEIYSCQPSVLKISTSVKHGCCFHSSQKETLNVTDNMHIYTCTKFVIFLVLIHEKLWDSDSSDM